MNEWYQKKIEENLDREMAAINIGDDKVAKIASDNVEHYKELLKNEVSK